MSTETTTDLVEVAADTPALIHPETGEALAPTIENAALVLDAVSRARDQLSRLKEQATDVVREIARVQGVKTFHVGDLDVSLSGGPSVEYDPEALRDLLRRADCPEERIDQLVTAEITYRVNRSVLKQLASANESYASAIKLAERPVEKRWSASAKPRKR